MIRICRDRHEFDRVLIFNHSNRYRTSMGAMADPVCPNESPWRPEQLRFISYFRFMYAHTDSDRVLFHCTKVIMSENAEKG